MQVGDYAVETNSLEDENCLIDFLEFNNFNYEENLENYSNEEGYVIIINVIDKSYYKLKSLLASPQIFSEEEFLKKINYDKYAIYGKFYSDEGDLAYEGHTIFDRPYGLGTSYYANGNKCREGVFERKGLTEGKEYYSNGQLKFEGIFQRNGGYGPNYPSFGNYYSRDGELIFSGKFKGYRSGVGFPIMHKSQPKYKLFEKDMPDLDFSKKEDEEKEKKVEVNNDNKEYPMTFEEFKDKVLELFFEHYSDAFVEMLKKRLEEYEKEHPNFMKAIYDHTCWTYDSPHIYGDSCKLAFEKELLRNYPVYDLRVIVGLEDGFRG